MKVFFTFVFLFFTSLASADTYAPGTYIISTVGATALTNSWRYTFDRSGCNDATITIIMAMQRSTDAGKTWNTIATGTTNCGVLKNEAGVTVTQSLLSQDKKLLVGQLRVVLTVVGGTITTVPPNAVTSHK